MRSNRVVLITGGSGFIGKEVAKKFLDLNWSVRISGRSSPGVLDFEGLYFQVVNTSDWSAWSDAVQGVVLIIHCAGLAHNINGSCCDDLETYRIANVATTIALAKAADYAGVKRLVFLSSIGVNGPETFNEPFTIDSIPNPSTAYARSKYEAEIKLMEFCINRSLEYSIIRPPLVYGKNAPGNFCRLLKLIRLKILIPLGSVRNKRSFIALENLCAFIYCVANHERAKNEIFLVCDAEAISTADFIARLQRMTNSPSKIVPFPVWALKFLAQLFSLEIPFQQLCGSLEIDDSNAREKLGWVVPVAMDDALSSAIKVEKTVNLSAL